jgi:hypothetical protein
MSPKPQPSLYTYNEDYANQESRLTTFKQVKAYAAQGTLPMETEIDKDRI